MKISGGELKKRTLKTPGGNKTRPSSGITRESIFNIISDRVQGAFVLDLYSGCGSLGIEALSRGASFCIFAEKEKKPLDCINHNIKNFELSKKTKVLKKKLPEQINSIFLNKTPDIIFMDPPYSSGFINPTLEALKENSMINKKTLIIVEHSKEEFPDLKDFEIKDTRKYGKTLVSFLSCMI
ncbi:MAG: 16S rRNA (guanine(966)-N(2))-methyltransferase RsmD [Deltaproteobacteria bacterium]|nr:MAG: 16S rRNA (guanine(966)-N(2))-methyltransferase RsmD [Deltaproteobacteria bacterium]